MDPLTTNLLFKHRRALSLKEILRAIGRCSSVANYAWGLLLAKMIEPNWWRDRMTGGSLN